ILLNHFGLIIDGNKKLSKTSLEESVKLNKGQLISEQDIFDAVKNLKAEYKKNHYHNAEINTELVDGTLPHSKKLNISIRENKKNKIIKISIEGNAAFSDHKIISKLKKSKPRKWYFPWRGGFDQTEYDEDLESLTAYYHQKGYRDFHIVEENVSLTENKKGLEISLVVYEGPKYYLRNITWEGNYVHSTKELSEHLGFVKGDVYNEEKFNIAVSESVSPLYLDQGYFHFMIDPKFTPIGGDSLDVHFTIVENQIVKIRKIDITGNDKTHENVIRRELRMYPGDIFNRKKLVDSYRDIIMLEYFENVTPDVAPVGEDQIDILLDVVEKSADRANFSMGYNGTYGLTGGGGVEFRNFRGRGQTLSLNYQRGIGSNTSTNQYSSLSNYSSTNVADYQSFSLSYVDPWVLDTPNLVGISYYLQERGQGQGTYLPFDVRSSGGSVRWGRRFKWPDFFFRGSWMFRTTKNKYFANSESDLLDYFSSGIDHLIKDEGDAFTFSTSGVSFLQTITRDSRNHPEFPSFGSVFTWSSTYSGGILGGDEDYHKHELDFDFYSPLYKKLVTRHNLNMGVLKPLPASESERSVIPPSAKFFMGGSGIPYGEMLRGYDDNSVGPMGVYSPLGGNIILKYTLELRLPLSENPTVYTLMFGEVGNVWNNFNNVDPFQLKRSAGIGIRMFMPMLGMIGFDMGYGFDDTIIDGDNRPQGWNYHILFGMPF
ncbi:MAG: outer membrane protein assembly factor BamA, partial [Fidelibacterota bacterium]